MIATVVSASAAGSSVTVGAKAGTTGRSVCRFALKYEFTMSKHRRRRRSFRNSKPSGPPAVLLAGGIAGALVIVAILVWGGVQVIPGIANAEPGRAAEFWTETSPSAAGERQIRVQLTLSRHEDLADVSWSEGQLATGDTFVTSTVRNANVPKAREAVIAAIQALGPDAVSALNARIQNPDENSSIRVNWFMRCTRWHGSIVRRWKRWRPPWKLKWLRRAPREGSRLRH